MHGWGCQLRQSDDWPPRERGRRRKSGSGERIRISCKALEKTKPAVAGWPTAAGWPASADYAYLSDQRLDPISSVQRFRSLSRFTGAPSQSRSCFTVLSWLMDRASGWTGAPVATRTRNH